MKDHNERYVCSLCGEEVDIEDFDEESEMCFDCIAGIEPELQDIDMEVLYGRSFN